MAEENKILQAKCRNLLKEYDDVLKSIIEEEGKKLERSQKLGNSFFEIAKDKIYNSGIREGMRRILAKINELASRE